MAASILHCDFESYSACDLKAAGLANYADDLSTGVHCMAYAFDDGAVELWTPSVPAPAAVLDHVRAGGLVYAHNASFELAIWRGIMVPVYDWPRLSIEQTRCTMAQAYAMGLPGALENAAPALGIAQRKDQSGKRVMLQLAKPRGFREHTEFGWNPDGSGKRKVSVPIFWTPADDPVKFQQLYAYCIQDVEVERALHHRMMELSPDEQRVWQLDAKINSRGVRVDLPSIDKAIALVEQEKKRLNAEMLRTTGGVVGACTEVQLLVKWIRSQGVELKGLAKADVLDALEGDLPPQVEAALHLRREAAKSSTAKLVAMKERASADGRVRGTKQYHGAATGRWGGRGMQTDNYIRPRNGITPEHIEDIIQHLSQRDYLDMMYGPVMDALADSLRGYIVPAPGHDLVAADFSNIEGRVLAWLAGEEWKLQAFRDYDAGMGPDLYILTYAKSFGVDHRTISKKDPRRQIGKVEELAFGFQGGLGAWRTMAKMYPDAPHLDDDAVNEVKDRWRDAHPAIRRYWYTLDDAFRGALMQGGAWTAGAKGREVTYKKVGSFMWCKLPSGRVLCYPYPKLDTCHTIVKAGKIKKVSSENIGKFTDDGWRIERQDADAIWYMTVDSVTNKWTETTTYGGSLSNNCTQGTARDLLADAMLRLEAGGYPIVMHVHDEIVAEIATTCDDDTLERIEKLMTVVPAWASGLPITAEGWRRQRYGK